MPDAIPGVAEVEIRRESSARLVWPGLSVSLGLSELVAFATYPIFQIVRITVWAVHTLREQQIGFTRRCPNHSVPDHLVRHGEAGDIVNRDQNKKLPEPPIQPSTW